MKSKYFSILIVFISYIIASVPGSRIHKPQIPYFGQSLDFQTIEMKIFSPLVSGMVVDKYSDLILNPAYIVLNDKKSFYLDFNAYALTQSGYYSAPLLSAELYDGYDVMPRWYTSTVRSGVQTSPIYNFASILPITPKITIAFMNRSIFDYGPFRSSYQYYNYRAESLSFDASYDNIEPRRIEIDENQQSVFGTQSELVIGMNVLPKLDLGFRLGHYIFENNGNLYDSKWAVYPNSSYADLNDESLDITGHQYETGIGVLYHLNDKMTIGFYGGTIFGDGDESTSSLDTSYNWSERAADIRYYSERYSFLKSYDQYEIETSKPKFSLMYEWNMKSNLLFRSLVSYSLYTNEFSGSTLSHDTTYSDRTYDHRISSGYYEFRRQQTDSRRRSSLSGNGEETVDKFRLFASVIYSPDDDWSVFSGIALQQYVYNYIVNESSGYYSNEFVEYSIYAPETYRYNYMQKRKYSVESKKTEWNIILPVGIKTNIFKGLSILIGTDLNLTVIDEEANATLFYPEILTREWRNDIQIVNTPDNNRLEKFTSDPPKDFIRTINNRFGLIYEHKSKIKIYLKSSGDIFTTSNWAFGFELCL